MDELLAFGCSWTAGHPEPDSWAKEFAIQNPDIIVNNYSLGGTSVKWSASQLLKYQELRPSATVVFQITANARASFTNQDADFDSYREQVLDNYTHNHGDLHNHVTTFTSSNCSRVVNRGIYTNEQINVARKIAFDDGWDIDMEWHEYNMYIDWLRPRVDFAFFHCRNHQQGYYNHCGVLLPSIEDHFGTKQFNKWSCDNGFHFGREGCAEVAKWIKTNLNK